MDRGAARNLKFSIAVNNNNFPLGNRLFFGFAEKS